MTTLTLMPHLSLALMANDTPPKRTHSSSHTLAHITYESARKRCSPHATPPQTLLHIEDVPHPVALPVEPIKRTAYLLLTPTLVPPPTTCSHLLLLQPLTCLHAAQCLKDNLMAKENMNKTGLIPRPSGYSTEVITTKTNTQQSTMSLQPLLSDLVMPSLGPKFLNSLVVEGT